MPIDNREMRTATTDTQTVKHNLKTIGFLFSTTLK